MLDLGGVGRRDAQNTGDWRIGGKCGPSIRAPGGAVERSEVALGRALPLLVVRTAASPSFPHGEK
jgi:hypothetical protein